MGIELDVLVGHPEHELVFFGDQVAGAAGIKDASGAVMSYRQSKVGKETPKLTLGGRMANLTISVPLDSKGRAFRSTMAMMTEPQAYQMLLRVHSEASEPFRKWVTEEVLPTIRKTDQYNAAESSDPIAVGIMDELKLLRGELVELKDTRYSI